ncbi:MAG: hypothetical protein RIQ83_160 [Pseudomonadota bacterium]|jgi:predicted ATP-dependent endonuclease of OLD family
MRLHEIHIKNFRKLRDCAIQFRDSTFLIGANNAGKSSVFSAIKLLHSAGNAIREDYSKTYNDEQELYDYAEEIEIIARYHNLPNEAKEWIGFKGRVIHVDAPLENETSNSITYKKVWSIKQSKPKFYMLEYPKKPKDTFSNAIHVSDLVSETLSEDFLKDFFGATNFDKKYPSKLIKKNWKI